MNEDLIKLIESLEEEIKQVSNCSLPIHPKMSMISAMVGIKSLAQCILDGKSLDAQTIIGTMTKEIEVIIIR